MTRVDQKMIRTQMKYCPICNRVWERGINQYLTFERYPEGHIPSYGKPRAICPICAHFVSKDHISMEV